MPWVHPWVYLDLDLWFFFNFQRLTWIWPGLGRSWSSSNLELQILVLQIQVPADLFVMIVKYYGSRLNSATKNLRVFYHFCLGLTWICEDLDSWRTWTCRSKKTAGFPQVDLWHALPAIEEKFWFGFLHNIANLMITEQNSNFFKKGTSLTEPQVECFQMIYILWYQFLTDLLHQ